MTHDFCPSRWLLLTHWFLPSLLVTSTGMLSLSLLVKQSFRLVSCVGHINFDVAVTCPFFQSLNISHNPGNPSHCRRRRTGRLSRVIRTRSSAGEPWASGRPRLLWTDDLLHKYSTSFRVTVNIALLLLEWASRVNC